MGRNIGDSLNWKRDTDGKWKLGPNKTAGFVAEIEYQDGVGYELVVTGTGAPAPAVYPTRKLAKHAFAEFLRTKP